MFNPPLPPKDPTGGNPAKVLPAIILAAGLSSRMGSFKPLMPLGGKLLIHRVIESLKNSHVVDPIVVVTGHRSEEVAQALSKQGVEVVFNADYAKGEMLSSVLRGIQSLPADAEGFLLAFADQPAVLSSTIHKLVLGFNTKKSSMALPIYLGKRGHPVVLSQTLIPAIRALGPNDSLRSVVHNHLAQATLIEVDDASILEDLDTPEDFARAEKKFQS